MDGIHDLGGKHGFGKVEHTRTQAPFQSPWEGKVFALIQSAGRMGAYRNVDRFRHAVERIDPVAYLSHGYYGRWLGALETTLVEAGILQQSAIQERYEALGGDPSALVAARPKANPDPQGDFPVAEGSQRKVDHHRFEPGQRVITATVVKAGHTRLPAYARGKVGEIVSLHDGWVFPDTNAHGQGEQPQFLYTVRFSAESLWGDKSANTVVHLDLFEPYLRELDS